MNDKKRSVVEIVSYLFWGVLTTIVCWGSYALFVKCLSLSVFWGNNLSWLSATLFAFITNKKFVFESASWNITICLKEFILFVSTRLGTGALEIIAVPVLVKMGFSYTLFGVKGAVAKIVVSLTVVILNYFFGKYLVFRKKRGV